MTGEESEAGVDADTRKLMTVPVARNALDLMELNVTVTSRPLNDSMTPAVTSVQVCTWPSALPHPSHKRLDSISTKITCAFVSLWV